MTLAPEDDAAKREDAVQSVPRARMADRVSLGGVSVNGALFFLKRFYGPGYKSLLKLFMQCSCDKILWAIYHDIMIWPHEKLLTS